MKVTAKYRPDPGTHSLAEARAHAPVKPPNINKEEQWVTEAEIMREQFPQKYLNLLLKIYKLHDMGGAEYIL